MQLDRGLLHTKLVSCLTYKRTLNSFASNARVYRVCILCTQKIVFKSESDIDCVACAYRCVFSPLQNVCLFDGARFGLAYTHMKYIVRATVCVFAAFTLTKNGSCLNGK